MLVGAIDVAKPEEILNELAHSKPAEIQVHKENGESNDLHRGRVLLEGYDFSLRAYVLRKQREDRVAFTMIPQSVQVNPVFVIAGWSSHSVKVSVNHRQLSSSDYRYQVNGDELVIWIKGRFDRPTEFNFCM